MATPTRLRVAFALSALLALSACGGTDSTAGTDPAAEKRQAEEAIASGAPTTGEPADPSAATCQQVGGTWASAEGHCAVTEAMCTGTSSGAWKAGIGCVAAVAGESECVGFSGMRWTQGHCVIASLNGTELAQNGL